MYMLLFKSSTLNIKNSYNIINKMLSLVLDSEWSLNKVKHTQEKGKGHTRVWLQKQKLFLSI